MIVRAKEDVNSMVRSDSANYALKPFATYLVIEIYGDWCRVVSEERNHASYDRRHFPAMYDLAEFDIVDASIPVRWIQTVDEDGMRDVHPPEFYRCFFDDLSEDYPDAVALYEASMPGIIAEIKALQGGSDLPRS